MFKNINSIIKFKKQTKQQNKPAIYPAMNSDSGH